MSYFNACLRLAICLGALMGAPHVFALDVQGKGPAKTYDVVSGDTLDKVIRATMADSPSKLKYCVPPLSNKIRKLSPKLHHAL
jgi:hypothetical protein